MTNEKQLVKEIKNHNITAVQKHQQLNSHIRGLYSEIPYKKPVIEKLAEHFNMSFDAIRLNWFSEKRGVIPLDKVVDTVGIIKEALKEQNKKPDAETSG